VRAARAGAVARRWLRPALLGACGARAGPRAAADAGQGMRVYNWADYIGKDTLATSRLPPASRYLRNL